MEFDKDLVPVQGYLFSLLRNVGSFVKVKHLGGKEEIVSAITNSIKSLLHSQYFNADGTSKKACDEQLRKITFYLILNTELKHQKIFNESEKFSSVINSPQLSSCVLANIVTDVRLTKWYCEAVYNLPFQIGAELLDAIVPCVKRLSPQDAADKSATLVAAVYMKTLSLHEETDCEVECAEFISTALRKVVELLKNFIAPENERMIDWSKKTFNDYFAHTNIRLMELISTCVKLYLKKTKPLPPTDIYVVPERTNNVFVKERTELVVRSVKQASENLNTMLFSVGAVLLREITVDVYCCWAEIEYRNKSVQSYVATLAYELGELVKNYQLADDFYDVLKTIAVKPKTLKQRLAEADADVVLKNAQIVNDEQTEWFRALLRSGCYKENTSALEMLRQERMLELFGPQEVVLLIDAVYHKVIIGHAELSDFLIRCAGRLSTSDLVPVIVYYLEKCGFSSFKTSSTIEADVQTLFNRSDALSDDFVKELLIALMQNTETVLSALLTDCLKSCQRLEQLRNVFRIVKPICLVEEYERPLIWKVLNRLLYVRIPDGYEEVKRLTKMYTLMIDSGYFSTNDLIAKMFLLIIKDYLAKDDEIIKIKMIFATLLELIRHDFIFADTENCFDLFVQLNNTLIRTRSSFNNFSADKNEIAGLVIKTISELLDMLLNGSQNNELMEKLRDNVSSLNAMHKYYYRQLFNEQNVAFINYVAPTLVLSNSEDLSGKLVCLLHRCVPEEWSMIAETLKTHYTPLQVLESYIFVMIVFCELTKNDEQIQGMKYCLGQFGIVAKDIILPELKDLEEEKSFVNHTIRLLERLPVPLERSEGVMLLGLFKKDILREFANDREFAMRLVSFSESEVCKTLARIMIEFD